MELKQLEFFVVCAQTSSFSKAADLLFTAQSNVSKVIKSLETELEMELFERKQYGITLTPQGRRIYEYACNTLESAKKIQDFSGLDFKRELRICCNPSSWMAACFCDYYQVHEEEDVSYSVLTASTNEIIRRLSGEIDGLGFIYVMESQLGRLKEKLTRNHLTFNTLKETEAFLHFGRDNDWYGQKKAEDGEIEQIDLVQGYEDEFTLRSYWNEEYKEKKGKKPYKLKVTTNSDYVMNELLVRTGLGNISGGYLSNPEKSLNRNSYPLSKEKNTVLFGCLFRNDKNLDEEQMKYLSYVKKRLMQEEYE